MANRGFPFSRENHERGNSSRSAPANPLPLPYPGFSRFLTAPASFLRLENASRPNPTEPDTTVGVVTIARVVVTRDGSRSAYSYYQVFSVLYLISGLR